MALPHKFIEEVPPVLRGLPVQCAAAFPVGVRQERRDLGAAYCQHDGEPEIYDSRQKEENSPYEGRHSKLKEIPCEKSSPLPGVSRSDVSG